MNENSKFIASGFIHADLDAFYASVEALDRPELLGKPVIVGGRHVERGVVAACSYEARAKGVHSAMPIFKARKLCPEAIYLPVRMDRYREVSEAVMALLQKWSPHIQQISIDEAFLDMRGTERLFGHIDKVGEKIRHEVREKLSLNLTLGIAANRYLAKLASAAAKPDGLFHLKTEDAEDFIDNLGLARLWGIGKKSLERLKSVGIDSCQTLRTQSLESLKRLFGEAFGKFLYMIVRGEDPGIFNEDVKRPSISIERTFAHDIYREEELKTIALELSEELAFRLYKEEKSGNTLQLKIRFNDFSTFTVQETGINPFLQSGEIWEAAKRLLKKAWRNGKAVRLLGLGVQGVKEREDLSVQRDLFEEEDSAKKRLEETILKIKEKTGLPLTRARLLEDPNLIQTRKK